MGGHFNDEICHIHITVERVPAVDFTEDLVGAAQAPVPGAGA